MLAVGGGHSLYLTDDGSVWGWGLNDASQIDSSGDAVILEPRQLSLNDIVAVACGNNFSAALDRSGRVVIWGDNQLGQAGDGTTSTIPIGYPQEVTTLSHPVRAIACGQGHIIALYITGELACWGADGRGQIGDGTINGIETKPVDIDVGMRYRAIAAGGEHSLGLTADGRVRAWGANGSGQIGDGTSGTDRSAPAYVRNSSGAGDLSQVLGIGAGGQHSLAVLASGFAVAWGDNTFGQLGDDTTTSRSRPVSFPASAVTAVGGGARHSWLRRANGIAACWGSNDQGQCRSAVTTDTFTRPNSYSAQVLPAIARGPMASHVLCRDQHGAVVGWGDNEYGQIGDNTEQNDRILMTTTRAWWPVRGVVDVACGQYHAIARGADGMLWSWGSNSQGQSGSGSANTVTETPQAVAVVSGALQVSAGVDLGDYSACLTATGDVYCWGDNDRGQHGDGTSGNTHPTPVEVSNGGLYFRQIAVGDDHTVGLASSGRVYCWGADDRGQLGNNNDLVDSATPVWVSNLTDVIAVATGSWHSLALTADGKVYAWGADDAGQLGDDAVAGDQPMPVWVLNSDEVVAIAAGGTHSLALTADGIVYSWGSNSEGQIGDGGTSNRFTADAVFVDAAMTHLAGCRAIGAGQNTSYAIRHDGQLLAWGGNHYAATYYGQLGDGGVADVLYPVAITAIPDAWSVDGGWRIGAAVRCDGRVAMWGANENFQLGLGANDTPQSTPQETVKGWLPSIEILSLGTDTSAEEAGASPATVRLKRSGRTAGSLDVFFHVGEAGDDAGWGTDYADPGYQLSIPFNKSTATIRLIPIDDAVDEADEIATLVIDSDDWNYRLPAALSQPLTIVDNDTAGIVVDPTGGLITSENGMSDSFTVVLQSQPTTTVAIGLESLNPGEGTVSPPTVYFAASPQGSGDGLSAGNASKWSNAITVTVSGVDDVEPVDDPDVVYSIDVQPATSGDPRYDGLDPANVSVTNLNDDSAAIVVETISGPVFEQALMVDGATMTDAQTVQCPANTDLSLVVPNMSVFVDSLTINEGNWGLVASVDDVNDRIVLDRAAMIASGNPETIAIGAESGVMIRLDTKPTATVSIGLSVSDTSEGSISPPTAVLDAFNYDSGVLVSLFGVDDQLVDGTQTYSILTATSSSADPQYNGIDPADIPVVTHDDDGRALLIDESGGGTAVAEGGATDTYTLRLSSEPSGTVTVTLDNDPDAVGAQITVTPSSVDFNTTNWSDPVTISVVAIDDGNIDAGVNGVVSHVISGDDAAYAALDNLRLSVSVTDNDSAGIVVAPLDLEITEGEQQSFSIFLNSAPVADVIIAITPDDTSIATTNVASVTFTAGSSDWQDGKIVTVTAVDNGIGDPGNSRTTTIGLSASSADADYALGARGPVNVVNIDDESAGISLLESDGSTRVAEDGSVTDDIQLKLNTDPGAGTLVVVGITGTGQFVANPSSVVFTGGAGGNWSTPTSVAIEAVDDSIDEASLHSDNLTMVISASSAGDYDGTLGLPSITVAIEDDDTAAFAVSPTSGLTCTEAGGAATFSIVLTSQPIANVTVDFSSSDTGAATVSPATVQFTAATWASVETITITGVDDDFDDGDQPFQISAVVTSSSPEYQDLPLATVSGTTLDNDMAGVVLIESGAGTAVAEASGTDSYSVALATQPLADTTVTLSFTPDGQVTTSVSERFFGPTALGDGSGSSSGNRRQWNDAVTITVTAVDDQVDEAATHAGRIDHAASGGAYSGVAIDAVAVNVTDDDSAGLDVRIHDGDGDIGGPGDLGVDALAIDEESQVQASQPCESLTASSRLVQFPAGTNLAAVFVGQRIGIGGSGANAGLVARVASVDDGLDQLTIGAGSVLADSIGETIRFVAGFRLRLAAQPLATVVVPVASSDGSEGVPTVDTLTFTPEDWDQYQTVSVLGVDDDLDDGDQHFTITGGPAQSLDPVYNGLQADAVSLSTIDSSDTAGVTIVPSSGLQTTEAGGTANFTMRLASQPTADVTIALSSSDSEQGEVSPVSLSFTASDWATAKTVTVTGLDDDFTDNGAGIAYSIVTAAATVSNGSDAGYAGLDPVDVAVTNLAVNAAPSIDPPASISITEDAAGETVELTGISSGQDGENQVVTVTATTSDGNVLPDPTVVYEPLTGTATLSLTPVADIAGSVVVTILVVDDGGTANGGVDRTTVSLPVTVAAVNDAPVVDLDGDGTIGDGFGNNFYEGSAPVAIVDSGQLRISDIDNASMTSASAVLASVPDGVAEVLAVAVGSTGIVATYDSASGTLALSSATPLPIGTWETVLRTLTYENISSDPTNGQRSIAVVVGDGSATSAADTATVGVYGVDFQPFVDLNGSGDGIAAFSSFVEDQPARVIAEADAIITDTDSANLTQVICTMDQVPDGAAEVLSIGAHSDAITVSWVSPVLTLSGSAPIGDYVTALRTLTYVNTDQALDATQRRIRVTASDATTTSGEADLHIDMTTINDPPQITANAGFTMALGATATLQSTQLAATDVDHDDAMIVFNLVLPPSLGELQRDGTALQAGDSITPADLAAGRVRYVHDGLRSGDDGFAYLASDGVDDGDLVLFPITVTGLVPPEIESSATTVAWTEDDAPVQLDGEVSLIDSDYSSDSGYAGGSITVAVSGGDGADVVAIGDWLAGTITLDGAEVRYQDSTVIGTWAGGTAGNNLVVSLQAAAGPTALQALLRCLQYASNSQDPAAGSRGISIIVDDGGAVAPTWDLTIDVTPVNDTPTIDPLTVLTVPTLVRAQQLQFADIEGDGMQLSVSSSPTKGTVSLDATTGAFVYEAFPAVSGEDSFVVTVVDDGSPALSANATVTVQISDVGSGAPLIVSNPPMAIDEGMPLLYTPTVAGADPEQPPAFELHGLAAGGDLSFSGSDGTISWSAVPLPDGGYLDFSILVLDANNGAVSQQPILLQVLPAGPTGGG